MASTYDNSLRLELIATGEAASTWGDKTNVNLTAIAAAFGYATQDGFAADANATTTVADGAADPARALYFKITSSATLTATRTLTIAPNTISRVMWIENATTGSQSIEISQGSGANVTIPTGKTAVVYLDGAGAGAAVVDAMASLNIDGSITAAAGTFTTADINAGTIDGTVIGGTTAAAGSFAALVATTGTFSGEIAANGGIALGDNDKATFGTGAGDLQIYHDGGNSIITNSTGNLIIRDSVGGNILIQGLQNQPSVDAIANGAVNLYFAGNAKLATTATGIDISGTATMDGLTVDSSGTVALFTNGDGLTQLGKIVSDATYGLVLEGKSNSNLALKTKANGAGEGIYFLDTSDKKRMFIEGTTGDISFYEDTGTTPKFFWDASAESLGIGNASPIAALDVTGTDAIGNLTSLADTVTRAAVFIRGSNHGNGYGLSFGYGNSTTDAQYIQSTRANGASAFPLLLNPYGGNVGIGTSSPDTLAHFSKASGGAIIRLENPDVGLSASEVVGRIEFETQDTGGAGVNSYIQAVGQGTGGANQLEFGTGTANSPTTRVTIDSSGNLLVGKTVVDSATAGCLLTAGGEGVFTKSGAESLTLNRQTSNGIIVSLRKDNTSVGSINSVSSDIMIGTGDTGLRFVDAADAIAPCTTAGNQTDAQTDIGRSSFRFKNLYLSGGVVFGTTGGSVSSKTLDDYEEGTWTPAISGGVVTTDGGNTYTKVGRLVTILMRFTVTTSSTFNIISGLPFAADTGVSKFQAAGIVITASGTGLVTARLFDNGSFIYLYDNSSGFTQHPITTSRSQYTLSFSYTTTA